MPRLELFDAYGFVSLGGLTEEKIKGAQLTDAQTEALTHLIVAFEADAAATARKRAAEKDTKAKMDIEADLQAQVLASAPKVTFQMAHAANAAAYNKR
jgi:hypothetical protein